MKLRYYLFRRSRILSFLIIVFLGGCTNSGMRKIPSFNNTVFEISNTYREPSLGQKWLVTLTNSQGKDKIEMIDIRTRKRIPLPGINRADSQPISVSVSANGERIALVRQRADKTEDTGSKKVEAESGVELEISER